MESIIELKLKGGILAALCCTEDYEYLSQWKWRPIKIRNTYYAVRSEGKGMVYMHRVIAQRMGITGDVTDHRDGNGLNNTRDNLRALSHQENAWNRGPNRNNSSGYKGVSWDGRNWVVYVQQGKRRVCVGRFKDKNEAAKRYNQVVRERFGDVAWINSVPDVV